MLEKSTEKSIINKLLEENGFDAGITLLYDKVLEEFCNGIKNIVVNGEKKFFDTRITCESKKCLEECINTLDTYECSIVCGDLEIVSIPVPVGSVYGSPVSESSIDSSIPYKYLKGYFI